MYISHNNFQFTCFVGEIPLVIIWQMFTSYFASEDEKESSLLSANKSNNYIIGAFLLVLAQPNPEW